MKLKKIAALALSALLCGSMTSCRYVGSDVDTLLRAPNPTGEMHLIQKTLEDYVRGDIVLKYPVSGEYRSAFIMKDLDGDGDNEALAFYTTEPEDGTVNMHLNLIDNIGGTWQSVSDVQNQSSGVDRVSFADFDGDGRLELTVGWSALEKQLTVYSLTDGKLTERMKEKYAEYAPCDLNRDGVSELLIVNLSMVDKTSEAKLYTLSDNKITEESTVSLDGSVTGYSIPVVSVLPGGRPAVYLDAAKSGGSTITELIYFEDRKLKAPFYDKDRAENAITLRPASVAIRDVNSDGVPEIPYMEPLPGMEKKSDADKIYLTYWRDYDGIRFEKVLTAVMNYNDGYSLAFPDRWISGVTAERNTNERLRVFRVFDPVNRAPGDELLRIRVFTEEEWSAAESGQYSDYITLAENENLVYAARINPSAGEYSLSESELRANFRLVS